MYVLEVMSGPLDGKTWAFEREITIGRDDAVAPLALQSTDTSLENMHASTKNRTAGCVWPTWRAETVPARRTAARGS